MTQAQSTLKEKMIAQGAENESHIKEKMKGPQQTKKRQKWQNSTQRATGHGANNYYRRAGIRETSYEVKPEWQVVQEFSK
jgi:hypothetical protein